MKYYNILFIFICSLFIIGCSSSNKEDSNQSVQELLADTPAEVTVETLQISDFEHELTSNGKISARTVAEVKFQTAEIITKILVKNGDRIAKGQPIAELDSYALSMRLEQAKDALERSRLEMQDVLIGQGYSLDNLDAVPENVTELAGVKSGFNNAQTQFNLAKYDLSQAKLVAPISGTIANLFAKPSTLSKPSEVFCNIIDTQNLEVAFTVLENELGLIRTGDKVSVTPFSMPDVSVQGRVTEINPWVNENGMVNIKASISYHNRLVEGMNVRVSAFRTAGKQWVVPKSAVVLRTGKQVVFTIVDGRAIWNYVDTGLENATQYTITGETLKDGDQIITTGNINLAHESPVVIVEREKAEN